MFMQTIEELTETAKDDEKMSHERYERMCVALYTYRLGTIGFLELLKVFEESLGLSLPQIKSHITLE
jgi:hypothetical protein